MEKRVSAKEVEAVAASMISSISLAWEVAVVKKVDPNRKRSSRQHNN